jgi:hypothetical protein
LYLKVANVEMIDGKTTLTIKEDIEQEEVDKLFNYFKSITEYKHIKNLYQITISNGNELNSFLTAIYSNDNSIKSMKKDTMYLEGNRLVANYCSFIGMLIDQIEKVLSKKESQKLKDFRQTCNRLYDEHFEYRFFVLLRNFIMHYSLPFSYYKEDSRGKSLEFTKSHLLQFPKWKHVKKELEQMSENINIKPYINPMNVNLTVLFYTFVYHLSKDIVHSYQEVGKFLIKYKVKAPAIVTYESVEEFKKGNLSFNPINFNDLQKAFEDVKSHPSIKLEINDITPEWLRN